MNFIKKHMLLMDFKKLAILTFVCVGICTFFANSRPIIIEEFKLSEATAVFFLVLDILLNAVAHSALHLLHREAKFSGRRIWYYCLILYRSLFAAGTLSLLISLFG